MRVAVTGASRGLGLAICQVLAERGDDVQALCRRSSAGLDQLDVTVLDGVDVRDAVSVESLRERLDGEPLDALISNAAVNRTYAQGIDDLDLAAVEDEYNTNVVGSVRVAQALLPLLGSGSKIMFVSGGSLVVPGRVASPGVYGYRTSKAALNAFGILIAEELRPRGIAVMVLNPGVMDTDMHRDVLAAGRGNPNPGIAPIEAAREVIARLDELHIDTSGSWLHRSGEPVVV